MFKFNSQHFASLNLSTQMKLIETQKLDDIIGVSNGKLIVAPNRVLEKIVLCSTLYYIILKLLKSW